MIEETDNDTLTSTLVSNQEFFSTIVAPKLHKYLENILSQEYQGDKEFLIKFLLRIIPQAKLCNSTHRG